MFELLKDYKGQLIVNGKNFQSITDAYAAFKSYKGGLTIHLVAEKIDKKVDIDDSIYKITVRKYMTNYDEKFFLHDKNPRGPMPFMIMIGKKIEETRGLIKMKCWVDIQEDISTICMRCGKSLTNPISQYLHLGPECGASQHIKAIENGMTIEEARKKMKEDLKSIRWEGWIIKSSIISIEKLEDCEKG